MRKLLIDTNVLLDVLLDRPPHAEGSAAVWAAIETGRAEGLLAAHTVTTIHYLIRKELGSARAQKAVATILSVFGVATIDEAVINEAMRLNLPDFEDSVAAAAARIARCDFVVTRDPRGIRGSPVRPLTPEAVLPLIESA